MAEAESYTGSEDSRHAIFDRISDAVFALDPQWRVTYANSAALELLCTSTENLDTKTVWQASSSIQGTAIEQTLRQVMGKTATNNNGSTLSPARQMVRYSCVS